VRSKPGLFVLAENDMTFNSSAVARTKSLLQARTDIEYKQWSGVHHGFAIRGRKTDPVVKQARAEAMDLTIAHFKKYL
jgi:dienelactone hydrolase